MLAEKLRTEIRKATLGKEDFRKMTLKTALGEVERQNFKDVSSDKNSQKALKKLIEGNRELIEQTDSSLVVSRLNQEIKILSEFIPSDFDKDEMRMMLLEVSETIKEADNNGRAMGVAMKFMKEKSEEVGKTVNGNLVADLVKEFRKE